MLKDYLGKLGLTDKEQTIYLTLASIGVQPASIIARRLDLDRVVTYKHLKKLESLGLMKVYIRDGIQYFGVTGAEGIAAHLQDREQSVEELAAQIPAVE
ncbi:MAG: Sugar-specific transcriptional regulator TrmB family, partial [Candidatus Peregrinibacteria bacterium Greene0416_62]